MIVMNIKLDNFFAFRDFVMNFSYPKKIVKSYISTEHLPGLPRFRYKKLLILMGSNASGKTSLGQMFNHIFNLMMRKQTERLVKSVCDMSREARAELDFVPSTTPFMLCRIEVKISPVKGASEPEITARFRRTRLKATDSYESASKRIDAEEGEYSDYIDELRDIPVIGYFFSYPMDVHPDTVPSYGNGKYREILEKVLRVLDAGIENVEAVADVKDAYKIHMVNGQDVLIQEGHIVNTSLLSSGTKAGIGIADILTAMKGHMCGFYYCDERFSYVQSEIEKAVLSLMLELLGESEQLIFTTHNTEMLTLPLPRHSYAFLKKTVTETGSELLCVNASEYLKRNTGSLRRAVENDIFSVLPDTHEINRIAGKRPHA